MSRSRHYARNLGQALGTLDAMDGADGKLTEAQAILERRAEAVDWAVDKPAVEVDDTALRSLAVLLDQAAVRDIDDPAERGALYRAVEVVEERIEGDGDD